jgi:hypothetical protein
MAGAIQEAAEKMPDVLGLSIYAKGKTKKTDGKDVVESCVLESADLVSDPATVSSLFESVQPVVEESLEAKQVKIILAENLSPEITFSKIADVYKCYQPIVEQVNPELVQLQNEKATRQLCESMKFPIDNHVFGVLIQLDEQTRKEHLQFLKRKEQSKEIISNQNINITVPAKVDWRATLEK